MSNELVTIRGDIDSARHQFETIAVDSSISFDREAGFAIQILSSSDFAMQTALSNRASVVNAVTNIAAIGISLNPAKKQAYLVPRDRKICLDISYIGLLDLAIASGSIRWGQAELVMQADTFTLNGFDKPPTHGRNPFQADRGAIVGAYVVVKTADGDYLTTTMPIDEILSIRDRASAWKNRKPGKSAGPWETDPGEMMKKTVVKRAYKLWPKTDRLDTAIHHLNVDNDEGLAPIDNEPLHQPKNLGLTPERAKVIRAAAGEAIQKFNEGNEWAAFEAVSWIDDSDEQLSLWSILRPHSALRTSIKRLAAEERKKQQEIDENPSLLATLDGDPALMAALQASIDNVAAQKAVAAK